MIPVTARTGHSAQPYFVDSPSLRSLVDYIFRRLGADYLTESERAAVNIKTTAERKAEIDGGIERSTNGHSNPTRVSYVGGSVL